MSIKAVGQLEPAHSATEVLGDRRVAKKATVIVPHGWVLSSRQRVVLEQVPVGRDAAIGEPERLATELHDAALTVRASSAWVILYP